MTWGSVKYNCPVILRHSPAILYLGKLMIKHKSRLDELRYRKDCKRMRYAGTPSCIPFRRTKATACTPVAQLTLTLNSSAPCNYRDEDLRPTRGRQSGFGRCTKK